MAIKSPALGDFGEYRFKIIGYYKEEICVATVVYTNRKEKTRITSFRPASKRERRLYHGDSTIHN